MLINQKADGIVFQRSMPLNVQKMLEMAFQQARAIYGPFEAVVIALPDEDAYHLQVHKAPHKTFLKERISRRNPVADFEMVVSEKFGHSL